MNTEPKHTPTPWHVNTLETVTVTIHANRGHVATVSRGTMNEVAADEAEANAAFIVRACNEHAALTAVAEIAKQFERDRGGRWAELKEALAALEAVIGGKS